MKKEEYYSQIGQDAFLNRELFHEKEGGFFVDVGATDGLHFSNTLFFEKSMKWKGICIEPNPIEFAKLSKSDRTCIKENYAISAKEGETEFLAIDGYGKGLSGIIETYDPRHLQRIDREIQGHNSTKHVFKVKTIRLQKLFDLHDITYVDYCSIDVEGAELQVLESIDYDKTYIKCFSIENNYGLEKETKLLQSKGYRLWKRIAWDDIFVRDDVPQHRQTQTCLMQPKQISREHARALINSHHAAFLPLDKPVIMEEVPADRLVTWMRFDLMAKYIYARHREAGISSRWAYDLYGSHEKAFNNYDEKDGSGKKGVQDFVDSFHRTLDSIKRHGFKSDETAVPVSTRNNLIDGAHRVAACLCYDRPVTLLRFNFEGWYYPYDFFRQRGLAEGYLDAMAYEYCKLKPNTHLVLLFPSAVGHDDDVRKILLTSSSIVYEKPVRLAGNGPLLLMTQVYKGENWLGDTRNQYAGAQQKASLCFKGDAPMRVFVIETDSPEKLKAIKDRIRDIYRISNHSVHINDTHEETLRVGQVLLNNNSIHFLNHARLQSFATFQKNYGLYRSLLDQPGVNKDNICLTASSVLALYGVRDARDIDYLHFKEALPAAQGIVNSHNKEIKHYPIHRDEIIFNPENHFYFDGVKIASIDIIRRMKEQRGEAKDKKDLELIRAAIQSGEEKTGGAVGIIFSKNRALQLDATLRSFFLHCRDAHAVDFVVIYTTSNAAFERQYHSLRNEYPRIRFVREADFRSDLISALTGYEQVLFLVDDNLFIEDFSITEAIACFNDKADAIGFSLRLGKNITYSYMMNRNHEMPGFQIVRNNILGFDWTSVAGGFGYPLEVSSSIYRVSDMLHLLKKAGFNNPNTLEAVLDQGKMAYKDAKHELLCFDRAVTFCNPANKVQSVFENRSGSAADYSPERLGELYEQGYRVDVQRYSGFATDAYHKEVDLHFVKSPAAQAQHKGRRQRLVSIVILNYNGIRHLAPCLDSIARNTPEEHEVIVFDNASTDGSKEYLRSRKDIILVESLENLGCPPARARAMALARGDYLIFLDNDTVVTKGWVAGFLNHAGNSPRIGMIGPRSNYVSGAQLVPDVSYKDLGGLEQYAVDFTHRHSGQLRKTVRLVGFCMFIRREVIDRIGSIDASFGKFGFEDDDYTWRAHLAGFTAAIADDVFVHHTGGPQGKGDAGYNRHLLDAWEIFKNKWGLPKQLKYGSPFDVASVFTQKFDPAKHYIPLTQRAQVESLIFVDPLEKQVGAAFINSNMAVAEQKWDEAIRPFDTLLSEFPDLGVAYAGKGSVLYAKGDYAEAVVSLEKAVTLLPEEWGTVSQLAAAYYHSGNKNAAFSILDDAYVKNPNTADILLKLIELYHAEAQLEKSASYLVAAMGIFPNHPDVLYWLGKLGFETGDDGAGNEALSRLKVVQPDHSGLRELQDLSTQSRREVASHVEPDIQERGGSSSGPEMAAGGKHAFMNMLEKADELCQKGEIDNAIQNLISGLSVEPDNVAVYHAVVEILLDAKRFKEALETIGSVPAGDKDAIKTLVLTAYCKEGLKLYDEAEEYADNALLRDPFNASALNLKGMLAYIRGDRKTAEEFFNRAIESDSGFGEPYTNLGVMKWSAGDKSGGLTLLEKGFFTSPKATDNATLYHAAISELKEFERAMTVFQEMKALHPLNRRITFLLIDILLQQGKEGAAMKIIEEEVAASTADDGLLQAALAVREKVGAVEIDKADKSGTVSLCMIVKNEATRLAHCLMSVKPVVHEMIVVDTGSTDRTKDIANALGAKVFDFDWTGDFSKARNFSLSKASGRWIFVLDADELISSLDHAEFADMVRKANPKATAYKILTRNYSSIPGAQGWTLNQGEYPLEEKAAGWLPSWKVRLFANNELVRFEGAVHEIVDGTLKMAGISIKTGRIPVHHYGMLDRTRQAEKGEAYYLLGKKKLNELENDPKALMELGIQAGELQKFDEALGIFKKVLNIDPKYPMASFNIGLAYSALDNYADALPFFMEAYTLNSGHRETLVEYARCELMIGDIPHAVALLEDVVRSFPNSIVAESLLAVTYCLNNASDKGLELLDRLKEKRIDTATHVCRQGRVLMSHGKLESALTLLSCVLHTSHAKEETRKLFEEYQSQNNRNEKITAGIKQKALEAIQKAGRLFAEEKDDEALNAVMEGISQAPEENAIYYFLARMLIELKRYQDALDALQNLPEQAQINVERLELAGYAKNGLGLDDEATELADRLLLLNTGSAPALNLKGILAYKSGDTGSAENFFLRAIASDPGYGNPHTNIGILRWAADRKHEALDFLEKGFVLSPASIDNATAYHNAVSSLGELKRAERLFRETKAVHSGNRRIIFLLIDILIQQQDFIRAMAEIENAMITFGPDNAILKAAIEIRARIGPKELDRTSNKMGTLSVCMIVKDEERHLARCLRSLEPVADELIVVDTGSSDLTKDIARAFGAKVFDFAWTGSFAEARNYSLSMAQSDWILHYDADEVLSPLDYDALTSLLRTQKSSSAAFQLTARNYTLDQPQGWTANNGQYPDEEAGTGWLPSTKVRLFVNRPDVRYEGHVHELVEPSLAKAGITIKPCSITVHHYGRLDREKTKAKAEEYYVLGKKKLEASGDNLLALKELAIQAGEIRRCEEAIELWKRFINLGVKGESLVLALHNMACSYFYLGRYADALATSKKVIELGSDMKENVITYAKSELCAGEVMKAVAALERLRLKEPEYPLLYIVLAIASLVKNNQGRMPEILAKLKDKQIHIGNYLNGFAENFIKAGKDEYAIALLEASMEINGVSEGCQKLLAECRGRVQNHNENALSNGCAVH